MSKALFKKGRFSEKEAVEALKGVVDALVYCHENKIVHRDIKLENIFYDKIGSNSTVKLGDFGLAHMKLPDHQEQSLMTTVCGTLGYTGNLWLTSTRDHQPSGIWEGSGLLEHGSSDLLPAFRESPLFQQHSSGRRRGQAENTYRLLQLR